MSKFKLSHNQCALEETINSYMVTFAFSDFSKLLNVEVLKVFLLKFYYF